MVTYKDLTDWAGKLVRMLPDDKSAHAAELRTCGNLALLDFSRFHDWDFLNREWSLTLGASGASFVPVDLPTTDVNSNAEAVKGIDARTMKRGSSQQLEFKTPAWFDINYPAWNTTSAGQGTPDYWTRVGRQLRFYPVPASSITVYWTGPKMPRAFDAAASGAINIETDEITDIPAEAHPILIDGILYWIYRRRGFQNDAKDAKASFEHLMEDYVAEHPLVQGTTSDQIDPNPLFILFDNVSTYR